MIHKTRQKQCYFHDMCQTFAVDKHHCHVLKVVFGPGLTEEVFMTSMQAQARIRPRASESMTESWVTSTQALQLLSLC